MNSLPTRLIIKFSLLLVLVLPVFHPQAASAQNSLQTVDPGSDLQTVIDGAQPGDTIVFKDGEYYQAVSINKPLTLKAEHGGKAILSGAYNGTIQFTPDARAAGMFSAVLHWEVSWVMAMGRVLLDYQDLENLISFSYPETGTPGPQEGFYYDPAAQTLYLRLQDQADPNQVKPQVNRASSSAQGVYINANGVTIEGFHMRHWRKQAVLIEANHNHIFIRNNYFTGNATGISTAGYNSDHRDIFIEYNEFSTFPVYQIRQAGSYEVWEGLYNTNLNTVGIHAYTNGITIRHNYLYELFDGIQVLGWKNNTAPTDLVSDISQNVIQNIVDNPLEFDPIDSYLNARAHHNFVFDAHVLVSMTSFQQGKILVDHNIFYSSPEYGIYSSWFKTKLNPAVDQSKPVVNITLAHNTVLLRYKDPVLGGRIYVTGSEQASYQNSKLQNNIVLVREASTNLDYELTQGEGFIFRDENILNGLNVPPDLLPGAIHSEPGFVSTSPKIDFHLRAGGAAVGTGAEHDQEYMHTTLDGATDLGAIEFGALWEMDQPGPDWADHSLLIHRPTISPSIDPIFMGIGSSPGSPPPPTSEKDGNPLFLPLISSG